MDVVYMDVVYRQLNDMDFLEKCDLCWDVY